MTEREFFKVFEEFCNKHHVYFMSDDYHSFIVFYEPDEEKREIRWSGMELQGFEKEAQ